MIASGSNRENHSLSFFSNRVRESQYSSWKSTWLASPLGGPSMYTWRSPQPSRAMEYNSPWAVVSMSRDTSFRLGR
ncbi:hypothetical protein D3C79_810540 [compost metagenome]